MAEIPLVIGFDPARSTGWAFCDREGVWRFGTLAGPKRDEVMAVLLAAEEHGIRSAFVEDCYFTLKGAGLGRRNVQTLKRLQDSQTRIVEPCETMGLIVVLVSPAEWQAGFRIGGPRACRKLGARRVAQLLTGRVFSDKETDMADAVCICEYGRRMGRRRQMQLIAAENKV